MKKTLLALTILTFTTFAVAQPAPVESNNLQDLKEAYNNQTEQVPSFVGNIIGGETISVKFIDNGTAEGVVGAKFDGLKIENISDSEFEDTTMKVNVTQKGLNAIMDADKPYTELRNQLDEENIDYKTTSTEAGIKFTIFKALGDLASLIGLNF